MKIDFLSYFSRGLIATCLLLCSLMSVSTFADIPKTLSIQGYVKNIDQNLGLQGEHDVRFTLYDTSGRNTRYMDEGGDFVDATGSGATVVWTSVLYVNFDDGKYSVQLGDETPFPTDAFMSESEVLGIKISDDDELLPRMTLNSIPYSIRSSISSNVDGDITPRSVSVADASGNVMLVIDENGQWQGHTAGLSGEIGPKGDQGAVGAAGPQGPKGDQGLKGDTGAVGIQGAVGATGPQGPKGDQGLKGDTGDVGAVGPQGIQGDTGDVGARGLQGVKGDAGVQGPKGDQGLKGDTGAVGAVGPQGIQGDTGAVGATGSQGPKGDQGLKGDTGAVGATGPQGIQGNRGATGLVGSSIITTKQCTTGSTCSCEVDTLLISGGASCSKNQYLYKSQPVLNSKTTWEAMCEVFSDGADAAPASINLICASDNDA
jgi:hypothetical protein